jgi:hypothetical protein
MMVICNLDRSKRFRMELSSQFIPGGQVRSWCCMRGLICDGRDKQGGNAEQLEKLLLAFVANIERFCTIVLMIRKDRVSQCESLRHLVSAIACLASWPPMHSENPLAGNRDHSFFRQRYVWHARVQRAVSVAASCSQVDRLLASYEGDAFILFSLPEAVGGSR